MAEYTQFFLSFSLYLFIFHGRYQWLIMIGDGEKPVAKRPFTNVSFTTGQIWTRMFKKNQGCRPVTEIEVAFSPEQKNIEQ
jgi:hypothetical protein